MKASNLKALKPVIAWLFLAMFLGFWSSNHLFFHKHIVDSQVVIHSHPYFPGQSHSHSSIEFQWIASNASLVALSVFLFIPAAFFKTLITELNSFGYFFKTLFRGSIRLLRAPPLLSFL